MAWVASATGLSLTSSVILANQDGPRPSAPFMTIALGDLVSAGWPDAVSHEYDSIEDELIHTATGTRSLAVSIQAFTDEPNGDNTAAERLETLRTSMQLPTAKERFAAAGLSPYFAASVRQVPELYRTETQGRALLEVRFYVTTTATETGTYIETVEATDTTPDPDETFLIPEA
jgi:hypothetical protein